MSDLARTDCIDRRSIPSGGIDALILIKHDGMYESFEGRVENVEFESIPWSDGWNDCFLFATTPTLIHHRLTINFSGDVIQRRAKEDA